MDKTKIFKIIFSIFASIIAAIIGFLVVHYYLQKPKKYKPNYPVFKVVMVFEDLAEKPVLKVKIDVKKYDFVDLNHREIQSAMNKFFLKFPEKYKNYNRNYDQRKSTGSILVGREDTLTAYFFKKANIFTFDDIYSTYLDVSGEITNPIKTAYGKNLPVEIYQKALKIKRKLDSGIIQKLLYFKVKNGVRFDINKKYYGEITLVPVFEGIVGVEYKVKTEQIDGSFLTDRSYKTAKVGEKHTVDYQNTNPNFVAPEIDKTELIVSEYEYENVVNIKLKRKRFEVKFNVVGHSAQIEPKTVIAGAKIGVINTPFSKQFQATYQIDSKQITLQELENLVPEKNLTVEVLVKDIFTQSNRYPQTKVSLNQTDITKVVDFAQNLDFNSGKANAFLFKRTFVYAKNGDVYEKYLGQYFKFEEIEFTQIPGKSAWFTKKILDFTLFNVYQDEKPENADYANSILKAFTFNISKITTLDLSTLSYDDSEFGIKSISDDPLKREMLAKSATDYALAVFGDKRGEQPYFRDTDFNFNPYLKPRYDWMPLYENGNEELWWLNTKSKTNTSPYAYYVSKDGQVGKYFVNAVFGLVLAKR